MSATEVVEITTPESDFLVTPGDGYHLTDNLTLGHEPLPDKTYDATVLRLGK